VRTFITRKKAEKVLVLAAVLLAATILAVIPAQSQNQTDPIIYQTLLQHVNSFANPSTSTKTVIWGDKIVTGTETYSNMEIILNGNLTIASGGSLTLTNVKLKINCTANGSNRIEVQNGGAIYIKDTDGDPSTRSDATNITAYNPSYRYLFWVQSGAKFQMNNSELHHCGYSKDTSNDDHLGLWINTNNTHIENNTLTNNYKGIILWEAHHNTIKNNNATNNFDGFRLSGSSNNILTGNTATNNFDGFGLYDSS